MGVLNVAFVVMAVSVFAPLCFAQNEISPEIFSACEAKTPKDFKQQLECVKEQAAAQKALNELKSGPSRQIVVQPKAGADVAKKPLAASGFDEADATDFCNNRPATEKDITSLKACVAAEIEAQAALAEAIDTVDSDIPGDPYVACRNYISAYQPQSETAYVPQSYMLQCLKAKAPTRDFGRCYQNYEQRVFTREVTTVSAEKAASISACFLFALAGGP